MADLSMKPDDRMRWIYDRDHPEYDSDHARWLRGRREAAIASAPRWMKELAMSNDANPIGHAIKEPGHG